MFQTWQGGQEAKKLMIWRSGGFQEEIQVRFLRYGSRTLYRFDNRVEVAMTVEDIWCFVRELCGLGSGSAVKC